MRDSFLLTAEGIGYSLQYSWVSLVAQTVKNLPAIWDTLFDPWVGKIPLEEGMPTHLSIPAWRIPWTEEPGGLQSTGSQRVGHNRRLSTQHRQVEEAKCLACE